MQCLACQLFPWCSVGLGRWSSWNGAQWLPFLAVVAPHDLGSPGEASSKGDHGANPAARRMEEVVWGCVRAAEDWLLLGTLPPATLPPAPGDVLTSSVLVVTPLTGCFGWAGFPKLEDLTDRRSSCYLPSCSYPGLQ